MRDSRRIPRGSTAIEFAKDSREMRTSSATAGNTNTEYQLLNMTGGFNGLLNQNYFLKGGHSVTHAIQGHSKVSMLSGEPSMTNSVLGYGNKLSQTQKQKPSSVKSKKVAKRNLGSTNGSIGPALNLNLPGGAN